MAKRSRAKALALLRRPTNAARRRQLMGFAGGEHCGQTWYPSYAKPTHDKRSGSPTVIQLYICGVCGAHFEGPRFPHMGR